MTPQKPTATASRALRALVVDDDAFMLEFISDLLLELGLISVITAADGKRGIAAFDEAKIKPDLILCDLHMPGTDGFQLMEILAQRDFKGGIILISGLQSRVLHSAELMAQFHQLNILAALEKPVEKNALRVALNAYR